MAGTSSTTFSRLHSLLSRPSLVVLLPLFFLFLCNDMRIDVLLFASLVLCCSGRRRRI